MSRSTKADTVLIKSLLASQTLDHCTEIKSISTPNTVLTKADFYDRGTKIFITSSVQSVFTTDAVSGICVWNGSLFLGGASSVTIPAQRIVRTFYIASLDQMYLMDISTIHKGSVAPTPPAPGQTWVELDALNNYIESWVWNGTYWLSSTLYEYHGGILVTNPYAANPYFWDFSLPANTNIYLKRVVMSVLMATPGSATNKWTWNLSRRAINDTNTVIATFENQNPNANTWAKIVTPVNQHINVAATQAAVIRLTEVRTGNNSNVKTNTFRIEYHKARI
ncbi:MAG: hypothetical protein RLZZ171_1504 [Cyanobacteriota bacterium]|jgi:hypothetical protein